MSMSDKEIQLKLGTATEKFIAKTLRGFGYWVYNIPMKANGQPCDIIAVKGGKSMLVWLIDGKHVRGEDVSFAFARVEPNQVSAMGYAHDFAKIDNIGFCVFFDRDKRLRWLPYSIYRDMEASGRKSVNMSELKPFEEVLRDVDDNRE